MPMGGPRASVGRIRREIAFIAVARLNSSPCSRPDLIWTRAVSLGRMISGDEPSSDSSLNVAGVSNLHLIPASLSNPKEIEMAKGQQKGNREAKKPKKEKIKVIAAAPSQKAAGWQPGFASGKKK